MKKQEFTLHFLASELGATLIGESMSEVCGISTLQSAQSNEISFLANPAYEKFLTETQATAVILSPDMAEKYQAVLSDKVILVHNNPYLAYAQISHFWDKPTMKVVGPAYISNSACIHPSAKISANVYISEGVIISAGAIVHKGAVIGPNCVIGEDSIVGMNSLLHANVTLYHGVTIGDNCILHSGVVIGSDGFGFAPDKKQWIKIAQIGGVVIEDDVEIGANTAIDRGALDNTLIERGVKLDNQIQIAHNVRVGQNTVMAACCAVAGSTTIGKNCVIGGASGIAGHLTIVDNVHITAMTMVIKNLKEPGIYSSGTGVQPNAKWRKSIARLRQLDKMAARLKVLEKKLTSHN